MTGDKFYSKITANVECDEDILEKAKEVRNLFVQFGNDMTLIHMLSS